MAPIPVYTNSPIVAAKPDGVTPKTAAVEEPPTSTSPTRTRPNPTSTYPAAQPGAVPSLPKPTGSAYAPPTPTGRLNDAPPPPQPGAVPPPPKAGEKYQPPAQTPAPAMPMPQQMSIPTPVATYPSQQRGTSSTTISSVPFGTQLPFGAVSSHSQGTESLQHPPGYHQNANASELDRFQRSAAEQREYEESGDALEGVWDAAKKFAQQTGERIAAVENEVWKKINKD
ncbi:hypothetical protein F5Y16DRAFT_388324 [Xylariaceae sp. FL0255]|nr:hypothetical protein F5Y16DRAFT_388324 [Xylariaceae sp. FL0255]